MNNARVQQNNGVFTLVAQMVAEKAGGGFITLAPTRLYLQVRILIYLVENETFKKKKILNNQKFR